MSAMSNQPQPQQPQPVTETPFNFTPSGNGSVGSENLNDSHKFESDPEVDQLSNAFGVMKVDPSKTIYLGGAHWVSIMTEVGLKNIRLSVWANY